MFYNAARAEVVQRLTLREQVLLASLATSAAIATFAFRSSPSSFDPDLLLLIPVLSGLFVVAFFRHDWVIRRLGTYLEKDLRETLCGELRIKDWDGSVVLKQEVRANQSTPHDRASDRTITSFPTRAQQGGGCSPVAGAAAR